jgi:hypothetical protein
MKIRKDLAMNREFFDEYDKTRYEEAVAQLQGPRVDPKNRVTVARVHEAYKTDPNTDETTFYPEVVVKYREDLYRISLVPLSDEGASWRWSIGLWLDSRSTWMHWFGNEFPDFIEDTPREAFEEAVASIIRSNEEKAEDKE